MNESKLGAFFYSHLKMKFLGDVGCIFMFSLCLWMLVIICGFYFFRWVPTWIMLQGICVSCNFTQECRQVLVRRHSDSTFLCIRGRNMVCRRGITQHLFLLLTTLYIDHFSNVVSLHLRMSCSLSITFWDIINPIGTCWAVNGWVDKISLERFTNRSKRFYILF